MVEGQGIRDAVPYLASGMAVLCPSLSHSDSLSLNFDLSVMGSLIIFYRTVVRMTCDDLCKIAETWHMVVPNEHV